MLVAQRGAARVLAALVLLAATGLARAGTGGTSAPVKGELKLDRERAAVGKTVKVRLNITALSDVPALRLKIVAVRNCAAETSAATPALVEHVKQGSVIRVSARFKITQAKPCLLVGEVVSAESANFRLASVFGATLNPGPPAPPDTRPGTTGDGRPTADFTTPLQ